MRDDRNDDLALRVPITGNMTRELFDIRDELRLPAHCCSTTDASAKENGLTGDFAMERSEDELLRRTAVQDVEAGPVHVVTRRWQGVQSVP